MLHNLVLKDVMIKADIIDTAVCGGYDGEFKCDIEISVDKLDSNGFVYDNSSLIDSLRIRFAEDRIKASCEELGNGVIRHIWDTFTKFDIDGNLESIGVRVYNKTGYVEASWNYNHEVPDFPFTPSKKQVREMAKAPYREERSGC